MAGPHIQAIQISCQLCSNVDIKDSLAHQIFKGPIKISNGPLKFGNLHVFEWDMGHWPILWAHHHFGLGLTLAEQAGLSLNSLLHRLFLDHDIIYTFR